MNFKKALIVYRKELMEMLRDKRTLFTTILLPIILYPLIFVGFSSLMSRQQVKLEEKGATIAIADSLNTAGSALIISDLQTIEHFSYLPYSPAMEKRFEEKDIHAIITISDSLSAENLHLIKFEVRFDNSSDQGRMLIGKLNKSLADTEKKMVEQRLIEQKLNPGILKVVSVVETDISTAQKKLGSILGMILPYLMIILLISGAAVAAADLVAGEKERHTLETLLVSSAQRTEIVIGKYLTIITMSMVNVLANLVSLYFSATYMVSQSGLETAGVSFPVSNFLILFLALIPLSTLYAAILLSISTFSRNMKEAHSYEQPILTISMLLGMISFFPAFELSNLMALVPVINISLLFKAVMIGEYQISHLLLTIGSTLLLDVLAILGTIKLFNTESVLFRTEDDSSVKGARKNRKAFFSTFNGIIYFLIGLVVLFYLGSYLQGRDLGSGLVQTQIFIIALPVLLILRFLKLDSKKILRMKAPRIVELVLIPFIAIPAAVIVSLLSQLVNMVFPFPSEYLEQLGKLFQMKMPLWQQFLIIAVSPGICEEILFRGFMPRFFEGSSQKAVIVITALLFAAFHLDPFRFLPVFFLGLLLGYLTLRSGSIYNSMLSHTLNNGTALLAASFASHPIMQRISTGGDTLTFWLFVPAIVIFIIAIMMFHKVTANREDTCAE
ncbi:MAG TPA: ABC transporter permease subunit/CPBP intramembrane protease [Candidatus Cloacimonadota bacterium]|nr:ABC transporter permease subunit/CPBP intramembrane protease [Candidatus Cloacimonadota bacterium]